MNRYKIGFFVIAPALALSLAAHAVALGLLPQRLTTLLCRVRGDGACAPGPSAVPRDEPAPSSTAAGGASAEVARLRAELSACREASWKVVAEAIERDAERVRKLGPAA